MRLEGARVWLTGASSGLGESLIEPLLRSGARVAITARREDRLRQIAEQHSAAAGTILVAAADVGQREAARNAARQVEDVFGGVDLAIFNAGIYRPVAGERLNTDDFVETMQTNYFGVLFGVEAVLPGMLKRRAGRIAVVSSLTQYVPLPTSAAYGSSKSAITHAMNALRYDLKPRGVNVTMIHPGFIKTPATDRNRFRMPFRISSEEAARTILDGIRADRDQIDFPGLFAALIRIGGKLPRPWVDSVIMRASRMSTGSAHPGQRQRPGAQ